MLAFCKKSQTYIHPNNANKKQTYQCISCEKDVFLKKGKIRAPHFCHYNDDEKCLNYDKPSVSEIHRNAQLILKMLCETHESIEIKRVCFQCSKIQTFHIKPKLFDVILEYRLKHNDKSIIADVALVNTDKCIIFEVYHTHKTNDESRPEPWYEFKATDLNNDSELFCRRRVRCQSCQVQQQHCRGYGECLQQWDNGYKQRYDFDCKHNCGVIKCKMKNCDEYRPAWLLNVYQQKCYACCIRYYVDEKNVIYLNVPYKDKDEAKKLGCKFDWDKKKWYCTKDNPDKDYLVMKHPNN